MHHQGLATPVSWRRRTALSLRVKDDCLVSSNNTKRDIRHTDCTPHVLTNFPLYLILGDGTNHSCPIMHTPLAHFPKHDAQVARHNQAHFRVTASVDCSP